ncbi:MAG TPA: GNAT family N-acetyltransferase [Patescibacteria group bacterium]|nr:GNAT family N-acetyltransferase [Patescibacteria group bacterium]
MIVRKAKKEDLQECFELLKVRELMDPSGDPCKKWWIESFIKKQTLLVAEIDNKIIGFIMAEVATGKLALIHLVVVKKEFRRRGIASLLLKKTEKELKSKGARAIALYAYANKIQENFFRKFGYVKGAKTYEFLKFI